MIVTEYMENGALDTYLKVYKQKLCLQVVSHQNVLGVSLKS